MAKSITFDRFEFGLDLRKGPSTSDANRLRVLKNAYVTEGRTIRKRPGCKLVATLEAGTVGLFSGLGKLNTFYSRVPLSIQPDIVHANPLFKANKIKTSNSGPFFSPAVKSINYAEVFGGYLYCSITLIDDKTEHHYLDNTLSTTYVLDVNCPHTKVITKISSKLWAVGKNGDTVRFCKTNNPLDWTLANDAGFLPVGLQQSGSSQATGLGFYNNRLAVFFADSTQIWQVDVDPAKHQFLQSVDIGTNVPLSIANMASDVFFYSPQGMRTITAQENVLSNLIDNDVGSPIDRELTINNILATETARAQYYRGGGQYWLYSGNKALVYTYSRTNSVAAWSIYEFPFTLDYIDELNAELYIRSGDNVYRFDKTLKTDNGVKYNVDIELSYLDFKAPGILKQILSMDMVITGSCNIAHRYDPRNTELISNPAVTISGDTRPGQLTPVELLATNISPVINNYDDKDFELHQITYYWEGLGNVS
jgi:hypothetical protein